MAEELCQALNLRFRRILANLVRVDLHARSHRCSNNAGTDVLALSSSRLCLVDGFQQRVEVFRQLLCTEGNLADRAVDDVGLVETILDLTGFDLLDGSGDVRGDGKGLEGLPEDLPDGCLAVLHLLFASRFQLNLVAKIQLFLADVDANIDFFITCIAFLWTVGRRSVTYKPYSY